MPKLGESGGTLTWMRYKRWPFFGALFSIICGFGGALIYSLEGALIGLLAGFIVGAVLGLVIGKDKKMFPVTIEKILAYSGGKPEPAGKFPGRVTTQTFTDPNGKFVERRIVEYLDGMKLKQLPNYSLPVWYREGETRYLTVLQIDSFTFLPVTYERGVLVAHDVPVYRRDAEGHLLRFKVDKDKNFVTVKNPEGKDEYIPDERGEPLVVGKTTQAVFDPTVMFEQEAGVVSIPRGLTAKMDNERTQLTMAVRLAHDFNRPLLSTLEKMLPIIMLAIVAVCLIFMLIKFQDTSTAMAASFGEPLKQAAAANLQAAEINAKSTETLARMGFNYSGYVLSPGNTSWNPAPTATPFSVPKIPFT